jgi:hypothetical protein
MSGYRLSPVWYVRVVTSPWLKCHCEIRRPQAKRGNLNKIFILPLHDRAFSKNAGNIGELSYKSFLFSLYKREMAPMIRLLINIERGFNRHDENKS